MDNGDGGQLAQIDSADELALLLEVVLYSTESLPRQVNWLIGSFTNPFRMTSTMTAFEKSLSFPNSFSSFLIERQVLWK